MNEKLVISNVRQHEVAEAAFQSAERARQAERLLEQAMRELQATHVQLQAAYAREHLIAEALQRPLTLEVPENAFPGLAVATLYAPALDEAQVGGDFFDIFALPRHRLVAVAIADASGKGLSAAVRTIQVKEVLRAFTREYPHSPAAIVARLNDYVCDNQRFDLDRNGDVAFSCLTLALIDPETGQSALVTAGCEPALLVRANGSVSIVGGTGLPLGVVREELYAVQPFHLAVGDTLVQVTDGITEARHGRVFLEFEGMTALAREALITRTLPTLRDAAAFILNGARAFANGKLHDDACVVLVRRPPPQ